MLQALTLRQCVIKEAHKLLFAFPLSIHYCCDAGGCMLHCSLATQ